MSYAVKQKPGQRDGLPVIATLGLMRGKEATAKGTELMPRNSRTSPEGESGGRSRGDGVEKSPVLSAGANPRFSSELLRGLAWEPWKDSHGLLRQPGVLWRDWKGLEETGREQRREYAAQRRSGPQPLSVRLPLTHLLYLYLALTHPLPLSWNGPTGAQATPCPHTYPRISFVPFCPNVGTPTAAPPGQGLLTPKPPRAHPSRPYLTPPSFRIALLPNHLLP